MTTIAYDGRILAADGLCVCGSQIERVDQQKIIKSKNAVYAVAGNFALVSEYVAYMNNEKGRPEFDRKNSDDHFSVLCFTGDNGFINCKEIDQDERWYDFGRKEPLALGSGSAYAYGAMLAGADAIKAVEYAAEFDVYTNDFATHVDLVAHLLSDEP